MSKILKSKFENQVAYGDRFVRFYRKPTYNLTLHRSKYSSRGKITSFSRHSRLRLRETLATRSIIGCRQYGLTLTLPWQIEDFLIGDSLFNRSFDQDLMYDNYKKVFNRFVLYFKRSFPNSSGVFRHELQRRGLPHAHLVLYIPHLDLPFAGGDQSFSHFSYLKRTITQIWYKSLLCDLGSGSVEGFFRSSCHLELLNDNIAIFRYLCDHTSKSKQSQLGYKGKQWGIIGRNNLVYCGFNRFSFESSDEIIFFNRHIRRLCRFKVSTKKCRQFIKKVGDRFGFRLSRPPGDCSILFIDQSTTTKLINYIISQRL